MMNLHLACSQATFVFQEGFTVIFKSPRTFKKLSSNFKGKNDIFKELSQAI